MSTSNCARYSRQAIEQRSFLAVIPHEELPQAEAGGIDRADSDQEGVGPRAARESGSLGIEEGPARGMRAADGARRRAGPANPPGVRQGRRYPRCRGGGGVPRASRFRSARPRAVVTTSPESSSSMNCRGAASRARAGRVGGGRWRTCGPPARSAGEARRVVPGYPPFAFSLPNIALRESDHGPVAIVRR